MTKPVARDGFAIMVDGDGTLPCDPPDACPVCRLFGDRRPGESRAAYFARITGLTGPTCRQGHPRTERNTYRTRSGATNCRPCALAHQRAYYARRKAS